MALGGGSFAGVSALEGGLAYPEVFGAVLSESPSLWIAEGAVLQVGGCVGRGGRGGRGREGGRGAMCMAAVVSRRDQRAPRNCTTCCCCSDHCLAVPA